jgi:hypothetical protein
MKGMTMKNVGQGFTKRTTIIGALVVMIATGIVSSVALAAQAQDAIQTPTTQAVVLDPYAARMISLASAPSVSSQATATVARLANPESWRAVRIPSRLPQRSAFRPSGVTR